MEPVLMQAGHYKFGTDDFEYVYRKNRMAGNQTLDECLALYIPYKLKIAAAKDAGLDTVSEIINEWTQYRNRLAVKYLEDNHNTGAEQHVLNELKTKYHFVEDSILLKNIFRGDRDTKTAHKPLFSFAGQAYTVADFEQYAAGQVYHVSTKQAYKQFVTCSLLDYESNRLETGNKVFRETTGEFLDGLLLFAITDSVVWSKAARDSAGLKAFYKKNARSCKWDKRMNTTIYYCSSAKVAERLLRTVKNRNEGSGRLPDGLFTFFCDADEASPCLDTVRRVLPKGANTIADRIKWKKGCSKILEWNSKFVFLDVHAILHPARKTFEEARGEVLAGYRDELESKWVEQLKKKYPVTIDESVWADLKKKYAE
jgi:peptidyl-prolyl cis-trans isomerase SurA